MTPKRQRMWFVAFTVICACSAVLLGMAALRDNIVFFYTPSELTTKQIASGTYIRLGGLVESGTVRKAGNTVYFRLTDGQASMEINYNGIVPDLFREGQGAIVEGAYESPHRLTAKRMLAKHDENYMPKEVAEKLRASGHWHGMDTP